MSQIYYYALEGSRYLLADERNKKHLLDGLLSLHEFREWPVYAFCVTDDSAYFIAETGGESGLVPAVGRAAEQFRQIYEGPSGEDRSLRVTAVEPVDSMPELARRCRAVHRLPLTLGYVSRIGDYWWSSYRNYVRGQGWRMVDCQLLLSYFSEDPEEALRKLRLYHTDAGERRGRQCAEARPDPHTDRNAGRSGSGDAAQRSGSKPEAVAQKRRRGRPRKRSGQEAVRKEDGPDPAFIRQ